MRPYPLIAFSALLPISAQGELTFRGLITGSNKVLFGLVDDKDRSGHWYSIGDTVRGGYSIVSFDATSRRLTLVKIEDSRQLVLELYQTENSSRARKAFNCDVEIPAKVFELAEKILLERRTVRENYNLPLVILLDDGKTWSLLYQGKEMYFGNHFFITIDRDTYAWQFHPGS